MFLCYSASKVSILELDLRQVFEAGTLSWSCQLRTCEVSVSQTTDSSVHISFYMHILK